MRGKIFTAGAAHSVLALAFAGAFAAGPAHSADLPSRKSAPDAAASDAWDGFYVGGHVGLAFGFSQWSANPNAPVFGTAQSVSHDGQTGPLNGGFQLGWNHLLSQSLLIGFEADATFPDSMRSGQTAASGALTVDEIEAYASLRGRFGYVAGNWLAYATGGLAFSRDILTRNSLAAQDSDYLTRYGYAAGAGVEVRLSTDWSAKLEYIYDGFPRSSLYFANAGQTYASNLGVHNLTLGLNYHFNADENAKGVLSDMDNWSIHGQTTAIWQGSLPMRAAYSGPQSLGPGFIARDTVSATAFLGYRIQPGTEIYFNPEPFQGFGLDETHGLGGFSNGEAQKGGFAFPHYNTSRLFVRQTFGLGGEQEQIDDGANQFGGKVDVSRVTVTAGKMAVGDIFDQNAYSHDPRGQFLNWSLMDAGAFDYAADQKGYAWGAVVELNQKNWAARVGYFLEPSVPNGNDFDASFGKGQTIAEFEGRYQLFGQQGKLRLDGWYADGNAGSFDQALDNPAIGVANIALTLAHRAEYGFIVNFEQAVSDNLGLFSRLSWRSGGTQIMAWTDIDESVSLGASLKGAAWDRPQDTIGLAGVVNGLSNSYRNFLAAGGFGLNVGDGALAYSGEKIVETYYQIGLNKYSALTFDYQFIGDPGYNAARGPANIVAARYHAQF